MKICICGGGSLGHVCAGVLSSQPEIEVSYLTRHPEQWQHNLEVTDINGKVYRGRLHEISSDAAQIIPGSDIVFCCLPGFAIESTLQKIAPYLDAGAILGAVVSSTGFFFTAHRLLSPGVSLFGFQRTPYIGRVKEYGHTATLLGYKKSLAIAAEHVADPERLRATIERLFQTPTQLLNNFYEASLTNSNPILHTGRIYSLWRNWHGQPFDRQILFYKEWTDEASQIIIDMDREFMSLLDRLPVDKHHIPPLLEYYESYDAASLTRKISSIPAFLPISAPMKEVPGGWMPDFSSRYFKEDFPHGLRYIKELAEKHHVPTPVIDKVYNWGMELAERYK